MVMKFKVRKPSSQKKKPKTKTTSKKDKSKPDWKFGDGRKPGTKNKFTNLKIAFLQVFESMGGAKGMFEWVEADPKNKTKFYLMVAKMLPSEVRAKVETRQKFRDLDLKDATDEDINAFLVSRLGQRGVIKEEEEEDE